MIGVKANVEQEITEAYGKGVQDFLSLLKVLFDLDISKQVDSGLDFKSINYFELFEKKVFEFVNDPKNLKLLMDYATQYPS